MNGEIDFKESFKQRMALLEGLRRSTKRRWKFTNYKRSASLMKAWNITDIKPLFYQRVYLLVILQKKIDYVHANELKL
jgi:phosphoserine phosphatase